ncbi:MAG: PDZ domain-containing protein [Fimbriiglobus sp.]|nr:PDZ domain-containing protein [Fimbriiglobus sp.]
MPRLALLPAILVVALAGVARGQDAVNDATEKAMKEAAAKAAPWVCKIETAGGAATIGGPPGGGGGPGGPGGGPPPVRKGSGPTTGLVIARDGYVITSSFNFANKPTDIFVTVPGKERKVAKVIASDTARMLTLLKIDATDLSVPAPFPKAEIRIGQWTLAMGRALDSELVKVPGYSKGIVSAVNRIWGKAVQTDCKVSPVNYGGPLVALDGRVIGVLVPASPNAEGDTAGIEWYDSGIGFAVPLEDVLAVFPRLKGGKDIGRGVLGFNPKEPEEMYNVPVTVGSIAPNSAAAKAELKVGDIITHIDGKPVPHFSALRHTLGPKYEGDEISLTVQRDGKEVKVEKVALGSAAAATFAQPFFGILPMRDDPDPGVEVRYVYPKSPADLAGLKEGDRILKVGAGGPARGPMPPGGGLVPVTGGRAQLGQIVRAAPVNADLKMEVKRKDGGKTETLTVKVGTLNEELPEKLPMPSSKNRALEKPKAPVGPGPKPPADGKKDEEKKEEKKEDDKDEFEKGLLTGLSNKTNGREYWMYLPDNYDKNKSYGVIIWLHAAKPGANEAKDMKKIWEDYCDAANFIIIAPKSKKGEWAATETEEVVTTVREALKPFTIDPTRVVAHGMGIGGSMALYMAFNARDFVRGVAVSGAPLAGNAKDNLPNQPLSFFLIAGNKDPLLKEIQETTDKLKAKKFPLIYREIADFGKQYIDQNTLNELTVWLDSMDRI